MKLKQINKIQVFTFAAFTALIILMFIRINYAVDLTDEYWYQAIGYSIAQGNLPFFDLVELHYGGNLFIVPLLLIYKFITGGYDGIMLFMRYAYFITTLFVSVGLALVLKRKLGQAVSFFACITIWFLSPYVSVASFSYNTLAAWFVFAGCVLVFTQDVYFKDKKVNYLLLIAGVLHGLAAFVYPAMIILCIVNFILILVYSYLHMGKSECIRRTSTYCIGGAAICAAVLTVLLIWTGPDKLAQGIELMLNSAYLNMPRPSVKLFFTRYPFTFFASVQGKIILVIWALSLVFACVCKFVCKPRRKEKHAKIVVSWLALAAITLVFVGLIFFAAKYFGVNNLIFLLFGLTIIGTCFLQDKKLKSQLTFFILPQAALFDICKTISSNTAGEFYHQYLTSFLVILALIIFVSNLKLNNFELSSKSKNAHYGSAVLSVALSVVFVTNFYVYVYRDEALPFLTKKVDDGIFKGIYTTEIRANALSILQKELDENVDDSKTLLVADGLTIPYVMTDAKPHSPTMTPPMLFAYGFRSADPIIDYDKATGAKAQTVLFVHPLIESNVADVDKTFASKGYSMLEFGNPEFEYNAYLDKYYKMTYESPETSAYKLYVYELIENQ